MRELRSEAAVGTNLPKDWAINHEQRRYFIDPSSQYQNVSSSQHLHMSIICDHCWSWAKIQQSLSRYFADTCNLYSLAHDTKVGIASRRTATAMVCKSNTKQWKSSYLIYNVTVVLTIKPSDPLEINSVCASSITLLTHYSPVAYPLQSYCTWFVSRRRWKYLCFH